MPLQKLKLLPNLSPKFEQLSLVTGLVSTFKTEFQKILTFVPFNSHLINLTYHIVLESAGPLSPFSNTPDVGNKLASLQSFTYLITRSNRLRTVFSISLNKQAPDSVNVDFDAVAVARKNRTLRNWQIRWYGDQPGSTWQKMVIAGADGKTFSWYDGMLAVFP